MPDELTMPKLSDSMTEAVIVRWLKGPGDAFARGEGLVEVETDKATVVYEAEDDGAIASILVPEGSSAGVGEPIAMLANGGSGARRAAVQQTVASAEPAAPPPAATGSDDVPTSGHANATPVARRIAVELGVSLHGIAGTGPNGRITQEDVQRAAKAAPSEAPVAGGRGETTIVELTPTQATIARRMAESASTVPVFTVSADIDMSTIVTLRREARERLEAVPSVNDFVVKAVAAVLRELPRFNASWADGKIALHSRVNVGVAVATEDALYVPVVADADRRSLVDIAAETRRLADLGRRGALGLEDLSDGTFTVSNLGMYGTRSFDAIVDLPQVAILAVGAVRRAPVEGEGRSVSFRDVMTVTLTADHRVVYGADGARFLSRLRELLERPLVLLL